MSAAVLWYFVASGGQKAGAAVARFLRTCTRDFDGADHAPLQLAMTPDLASAGISQQLMPHFETLIQSLISLRITF